MESRFHLCYSQIVACRLVTQPCGISFAPSTPRIYNTCTLLEPEGEVGTLTFKSRLTGAHQRLFLATLDTSSAPGLQVVVKLVPRSYSVKVHRYMADKELAPKLYGYAEVEGTLTAYVMEYLDPSAWQTLHQRYKPKLPNSKIKYPLKLRTALDNIIKTLRSENYVHGDLRTNNIMINVTGNSVDLRVIDFDWAGEAEQVSYPAERNRDIQWPGEAGEPIVVGHDSEMVNSWLAQ